MTTLGLTPDMQTISDPQRVTRIREADITPPAQRNGVQNEQIQALLQQLFFRQNPALVRHVGFTAIEAETETASLCLEVALALAEAGQHEVGLIDARLKSAPLHEELQIPMGSRTEPSWLIADRLWFAPRRSWLDDSPQGIWDPSLARLRTTAMEFDFSILCLDPVSWLTAKLGQTCHGLVMVLTANKTRRLVAAQRQNQLRKARVPLLGTVLVERRFPIPTGLYRNL